MATASTQVPHAALAQQQEDVKDRTAHQKENPLDSILLQADSAAQPFLATAAEQPTRAWVDYSKSQRPLQVLVRNQRSTVQYQFVWLPAVAAMPLLQTTQQFIFVWAVLPIHQLADVFMVLRPCHACKCLHRQCLLLLVLQVVDPEVEMINPADWDVVCDVRTPDEFKDDRIIGAINTPVLSNQQRAEVGTMYKQV